MKRAMVVVCVAATVSIGCATRGSVRRVADDVQTLRAEVGGLRRSQDDLSGRVIELATAVQSARDDTEQVRAKLGGIGAELERLSATIHGAEESLKEVKGALAARVEAPSPPSAPPAPAPAPEPPKAAGRSPESLFAAGLANFRTGEYGQAVIDFLDVVTKYPSQELAATAQFWIGEAYYRQHDYRQALIEFQRAVDWPPPNPKAADALLKTGLCYGQLREAARAQQAWRRVLREFPASPAADAARGLLAGKGGASRPER